MTYKTTGCLLRYEHETAEVAQFYFEKRELADYDIGRLYPKVSFKKTVILNCSRKITHGKKEKLTFYFLLKTLCIDINLRMSFISKFKFT